MLNESCMVCMCKNKTVRQITYCGKDERLCLDCFEALPLEEIRKITMVVLKDKVFFLDRG